MLAQELVRYVHMGCIPYQQSEWGLLKLHTICMKNELQCRFYIQSMSIYAVKMLQIFPNGEDKIYNKSQWNVLLLILLQDTCGSAVKFTTVILTYIDWLSSRIRWKIHNDKSGEVFLMETLQIIHKSGQKCRSFPILFGCTLSLKLYGFTRLCSYIQTWDHPVQCQLLAGVVTRGRNMLH